MAIGSCDLPCMCARLQGMWMYCSILYSIYQFCLSVSSFVVLCFASFPLSVSSLPLLVLLLLVWDAHVYCRSTDVLHDHGEKKNTWLALPKMILLASERWVLKRNINNWEYWVYTERSKKWSRVISKYSLPESRRSKNTLVMKLDKVK
jgi:hypothetical protein